MNAAYPIGDYTITISSSGGPPPDPDSVTISYTADAYTNDIPLLTAGSLTALQDLSTGSGPLTLNFNSFTPDPLVTPGASATFFTIFGSSQFCSGLAPTATSCTIDPTALTPGTTYGWELDFSDRIGTTSPNGAVNYLGFDVRTDGSFTTAAAPTPEASTWAMIVTGFAGLAFAAKRRATVHTA